MDKETIIERAKAIYGDLYDYSLIEETRTKEDIKCICPIHGVFKKRLERFLKGRGCPKCSGKLRKEFSEFAKQGSIVHNGKYIYNDDHYVNSHTDIMITCPIHGDFPQTPTNHLNGCGCPKCKTDKLRALFMSNTDDFITKSKVVHGDDYIYDKTKYEGNDKPLIITCRKHGDFPQLPHNHLQGKGCPICNESKLERHVAELLDEHDIRYTRQWHLPWNKRYSLDFLINENIGIECQGIQHFEDGHFKNTSLDEVQARDAYKLKTCNENNINIIYYSDAAYPNCICNDEELINKILELWQ